MNDASIPAPMFPDTEWESFRTKHWPKKPLFRKGKGAPVRGLEDLSTPGGIVALAVRSQMELKALLPSRSQEHNEIKIGAADILPVFDSGATIACNSLHRWHPEVRRWTEFMANLLTGSSEIGVCNAYVTPAGPGVPMHFDDHEIIVVQLAGKKTWTYAPNLQIVNPTANSGRILSEDVQPYATGAAPDKMPKSSRKSSMLPGSFLFLPRGFWHETDATELSISLTFGFRTPCWAELISSYLRQKLIISHRWREPAWNIYRNDSNQDLELRWRDLAGELENAIGSISAGELALRETTPSPTPTRRRRL